MKKLREIMTTDLHICYPEDNVYEASVKMHEYDIGAVPICKGKEIIGLVTDRDIVVRGVAQKRPGSTRITDIMTKDLVLAHPNMTDEEAADIMAEHQIRRLPVVENNELVGIVALGDLAIKTASNEHVGFALTEISEQDQIYPH